MELNLDWRSITSAIWPEVCYEIRPLKVWAFQELLTFWESHGREREGEKPVIRIAPVDGVKLMAVAKTIFPEHVRGLRGLNLTQEGETREATLDALCEETALMHLAGEIITQLMAISEVNKGDEKN